MTMDYAQELDKYPDASDEEKAELRKLAELQKDIAIGDSAEDFIRHPFFKSFENKMNDMINDSKSKILDIQSVEELKAYQASISAIRDLKAWLNAKVMAGRVGRQAIEMYEKDTEDMNAKIQKAIDESKQ